MQRLRLSDDPEFELYDQYPLTSNDPEVTAKVTAAFEEYFGDRAFTVPRLSASEDFSEIPDAFGVSVHLLGVGRHRSGASGTRQSRRDVWPGTSRPTTRRGSPRSSSPTLNTGPRRIVVAALAWSGVSDGHRGSTTPTSLSNDGRPEDTDRLLFGMILGVLAFWLFAQTTLNIAPDDGGRSWIETA